MDILSHVLVSPNVMRVACGKNRTPLLAPDTIVVHYTGGGDARSSALYLADPATKASAHVVIARDGQVFQLVPFNVRAWHAGVNARVWVVLAMGTVSSITVWRSKNISSSWM